MNVVQVEDFGFEAPEIAAFRVDQVPDTHQEWSEAVSELNFDEIIGNMAVNGVSPNLFARPDVSYTMSRHPKSGETRDWWSNDHLWHVDGTRWDVQPTLTVMGCKEAEVGAPPTDFLDSVKLLQATLEEGFWDQFGLNEAEVRRLFSVFADSTYQREAIPFLKSLMNKDDQEAIEKVIERDLEKNGCSTVEELVAKTDKEHPAKAFNLVPRTPFSGLESLFFDGGGRNYAIQDESGNDYTEVLHALRLQYLTDRKLRELGILKSVGWAANQCLVFPQIGVFHRANPGNQYDRELHLGFISQQAA